MVRGQDGADVDSPKRIGIAVPGKENEREAKHADEVSIVVRSSKELTVLDNAAEAKKVRPLTFILSA